MSPLTPDHYRVEERKKEGGGSEVIPFKKGKATYQ